MPVLEDLYPSRIDDAVRLIPRIDPVIHGTGRNGPIVADDMARYEAQGFLAQSSLLTPAEVSDVNDELAGWLADPAVADLDETITEPGSGAVRSIFRIHDLHPRFAALARDPRLLDAARQILGGDVYLHQSRVNFKPGFAGKDFYWHSDFETWHVEDGMPRMRALSVSVALTDNLHVNGPLMLMPGSHRTFVACAGRTPDNHYKASLKRQEYGVPDHDSLRTLATQGGIEAPIGPAGTAVFFDCNTMHGSNGNITPFPRSNVFFVYNSVDNQLAEPYCGLTPRPGYIARRGPVAPLGRQDA